MFDLRRRRLTRTETINIFVALQLQSFVVTQGQPFEQAVPDLINITRERWDCLARRICRNVGYNGLGHEKLPSNAKHHTANLSHQAPAGRSRGASFGAIEWQTSWSRP